MSNEHNTEKVRVNKALKKAQKEYSVDFQRSAIQALKLGVFKDISHLSDTLGVPKYILRTWTEAYEQSPVIMTAVKHGNTGQRYTLDTKREAIELYMNHDSMSLKALAKRYGIHIKTAISWEKQYMAGLLNPGMSTHCTGRNEVVSNKEFIAHEFKKKVEEQQGFRHRVASLFKF